MIDYKKLALAHSLAEKAIENGVESIVIEFNSYHGLAANCGHALFLGNGGTLENCDIDTIIDKLHELIKPNPKYRLDKIVWLYNYHDNKIDSFKIDAITKSNLTYSGESCDGSYCYEEVPENDLYSSKEALIQAKFEYWKKERISASTTCKQCGMERFFDNQCYQCGATDSMPCVHEPLSQYLLSDTPQKECKKCGEFYK